MSASINGFYTYSRCYHRETNASRTISYRVDQHANGVRSVGFQSPNDIRSHTLFNIDGILLRLPDLPNKDLEPPHYPIELRSLGQSPRGLQCSAVQDADMKVVWSSCWCYLIRMCYKCEQTEVNNNIVYM